jgi:hypothetical protein
METRVLQVASSFTCIPIAKTMRPVVVEAGIADDLGFSQYSQMTEYMLGRAPDSPQILGTVILVRVEDWLRDDLKSLPAGTSDAVQKARQSLRANVDEFASQVNILAQRGKPVWFLACPSTGWIAQRHKLETLCRTFTNLLVTRIQGLPAVTNLTWPASLANAEEFSDRNADRLGQIPFTQDGFDRLGQIVGEDIEWTFAGKTTGKEFAASAGTPDLAAYLSGLQVRVRLSAAKAEDRPHIDRILRTVAAFSLLGEKRDLAEAEVDALLEPGRCMLVRVSDRLSDHGVGGLIAFRPVEESLVVDAMALSCPVLGKQVEYALVAGLAQVAVERNCAKLIFEYRASARNQITATFLRALSDEASATRYVLPVAEAEERITKAAVAPGTWTLELGT